MGLKKAASRAGLIAATLLVTGWTVTAGVGIAGADPAPDPTVDPAAPAAPTGPAPGPAPAGQPAAAAPAGGPKTSITTDGTFVVGTDIAPGTYASAGPVGDGTCYWKRMSNAPDHNMIDNALTKKPQIVQIDPTDAKFKTDGCQAWTLTDQTPPPTGGLPALLGGIQLGSIMNDLNNRAAQAPPAP
jgi:hypothetical protein